MSDINIALVEYYDLPPLNTNVEELIRAFFRRRHSRENLAQAEVKEMELSEQK